MTRHRLPAPLTSFVGRAMEIAAVRQLLTTARLVTLTGAGGVGKTRLALVVAERARRDFPGGVTLVLLAPITDARLVIPTLAQALDIHEAPGRPLLDTLAAGIGEQPTLIVADNLEQVLAAAPNLVGLLERASRLTLLVTSRSRLHVSGEHVFEVGPLKLPAAGAHGRVDVGAIRHASATRLFVDRAQAVAPGFSLTPAEAPAIAAICRRLDGLPLAIELAASRVRHLPAPELLHRLERRFPLLTGGPADAPARHQTLRSAITWSYDLLDSAERRLFSRLAVFVGGFTLEAVEQVTRDAAAADEVGAGEVAADAAASRPVRASVLDLLASLVDKSLVRQVQEQVRPGTPVRFFMLETIRELAAERLRANGEEADLRRRHAEYFARWAEEVEPLLRSNEQLAWVARVRADYDNLRAAMTWAVVAPDRTALGLRLVGALSWFQVGNGSLGEGRRWAERLLGAGVPVASAVRAFALAGTGRIAHYQGDHEQAARYLMEADALYGELGDDLRRARLMSTLGLTAIALGDYARAGEIFRRSVALSGDRDLQGTATTNTNYARALLEQGDLTRAHALLEDAVAAFREAGDLWALAVALSRLGIVARLLGQPDRALTLSRESVSICGELRDRRVLATGTQTIGLIALARGEHARAARLLMAVRLLREQIGVPLYPAERPVFDEQMEQAQAALSPDGGEAAASEVHGWSLAEIVAYALAAAEHRSAVGAPSSAASAVLSAHRGAIAGPPDPGPLSSREASVAALVAQGRSNREIAQALVISERTVETHVRNVRARLGLTNRASVAAWAVEHGFQAKR